MKEITEIVRSFEHPNSEGKSCALVTLAILALQAIHGPAGLDIGAESPEEIAISILAEIKAVFSGKGLSIPNSPIHNLHLG